jgi:hypothetical protein
MKDWLVDVSIGIALGAAVVVLMLFASFNSTFVYRGF